MNDLKLSNTQKKSKGGLKRKLLSTKSTQKAISMSLAKQWLMRFSEKHQESGEDFSNWLHT